MIENQSHERSILSSAKNTHSRNHTAYVIPRFLLDSMFDAIWPDTLWTRSSAMLKESIRAAEISLAALTNVSTLAVGIYSRQRSATTDSQATRQ